MHVQSCGAVGKFEKSLGSNFAESFYAKFFWGLGLELLRSIFLCKVFSGAAGISQINFFMQSFSGGG